MSEKKPAPLIPNRPPKVCPVCRHASYSTTGIHPQCVVDQADAKRREALRLKQRNEADENTESNDPRA